MNMIVVSSYDFATRAFEEYGAQTVISIRCDDEQAPPSFPGISPSNHIVVTGDCSSGQMACAEKVDRCQQLINAAKSWDQSAPLLIHCSEGVARSMAAAFIILCVVQPDRDEGEIAREIRQAAPHADPNLLLISEADALLNRDDRMIEAVLDLCPCSTADGKPVVTLPLAA